MQEIFLSTARKLSVSRILVFVSKFEVLKSDMAYRVEINFYLQVINIDTLTRNINN